MPILNINSTSVAFPFQPYDCQLTYMRGVLDALDGSANALLESPTGTGKTLCLLCASLAWQQRNAIASQVKIESTKLAYENDTVTDLSKPPSLPQQQPFQPTGASANTAPSVIIYASRTHSQLGQVASELKNTVYQPTLSFLGSRDQLCVHDEVSKMKGAAKNHACQALVTDIEELVSLAKSQEFCPYYLGRGQAPRAELVLMPYNYLLDPGARRGIKLNWSNSVVIFDEAHNLESVASEASSFELTSAQVAGAQEEALRCHTLLTNGESGAEFDQERSGAQADNALLVKHSLHLLEDAVESVELPTGSKGVTRAGEFVYALFGHAGITFDNVQHWLAKLQEMTDTLQENAPFGHAAALKLDSIARAVKVAFRGGNASKQDCQNFAQMYRAHVAPAESVAPMDAAANRGGSRGRSPGGAAGRVLCFWCFCPGVAMEDLRALGVRSILVTSGTLSPMSSFANELRLPFQVQVENPHVIGPEQAWIGTLGRGVTNVTLNSSYSNRDNDQYKDELGATLANLCRIVPGGMLVFFSTYGVMNACVQRWKHHDSGRAWSRIAAHKEPMVEPRTAADLKAVMEEYDMRIENTGGAVFLAVCRGKVSEGMDFSDNRARCVVVTGIPYAPAMDAKVILKKKYMSETLLPPGVPRVTGQEWYQQQASRAVNQAIGRVIRHRFDFGCVVLCDERFAQESNRKSLSLWARPFVRQCGGFGKVAADLTRFFKACAANPSLRHDSTPKSQKPIAAGGPPAPRRYSRQSLPPSLTGRSSGRNPHDEAPGVRSSGLDLSALQDVGDIVQSVAGGSDMGGAGLGGNGGNGAAAALSAAAPLGLLHALKASAQAVGDHANAAAAAVATTTMTASRNTSGNNNKSNGSPPFSSSGGSGSSSSRSAFAGAHNGASRNKDHARDASRGTAPGGGGGGGGAWESIPLSQRLAGAGKSAGTAPAGQGNAVRKDDGGGGGGGALVGGNDGRNMKSHLEQQQHQQQQSQQLRRASGLGTRRVLDGGVERGAGGDAKKSPTARTIRATPTPTPTPAPNGTSAQGGLAKGAARAAASSGRRQELATFLSDLKKNVAPGAYDVFRSRAKAMKEEGVLDTATTALPALKGVLEVLMLAPPELELPQRFAPHVPEMHAEVFAALVAKRCPAQPTGRSRGSSSSRQHRCDATIAGMEESTRRSGSSSSHRKSSRGEGTAVAAASRSDPLTFSGSSSSGGTVRGHPELQKPGSSQLTPRPPAVNVDGGVVRARQKHGTVDTKHIGGGAQQRSFSSSDSSSKCAPSSFGDVKPRSLVHPHSRGGSSNKTNELSPPLQGRRPPAVEGFNGTCTSDNICSSNSSSKRARLMAAGKSSVRGEAVKVDGAGAAHGGRTGGRGGGGDKAVSQLLAVALQGRGAGGSVRKGSSEVQRTSSRTKSK